MVGATTGQHAVRVRWRFLFLIGSGGDLSLPLAYWRLPNPIVMAVLEPAVMAFL